MDLSIPEYFKNKEIFITGASGFIGKVLVEKILRSCHNFKVIYLLLREKKGHSVQERLKELLENELFDIVREKNPEVFKKVQALSGDVSSLKLGLSSEDRARVRGVHVVFHVAASVRFDDPLRKATLMNTRGTREVMELMLEMPCLEVGVHVSTTYCNTDKEVIHERVYRDHGDWREAIRVAENFEDDYKFACLTEKCLGNLKNTYLLTKHLAENIVEDYSNRLPLVLYRPGVVVSAWEEPLPGWVDNMNGPIGLHLAVGKGVMSAMHSKPDVLLDYIPVDIIVKGLIVAAWTKAIKKQSLEKLPVYNTSMVNQIQITQQEAYTKALEVAAEYPYINSVRYPQCSFTDNFAKFWIMFIACDMLLGYLIDTLLQLFGRKPTLLRIFRKVYYAILSVSYFTHRNWDFKSDNFWDLTSNLLPVDRKDFYYSMKHFNTKEFALSARLGSSKYLLKEDFDWPTAKKQYKRHKILFYTLKYTFYGALFYIVWSAKCL